MFLCCFTLIVCFCVNCCYCLISHAAQCHLDLLSLFWITLSGKFNQFHCDLFSYFYLKQSGKGSRVHCDYFLCLLSSDSQMIFHPCLMQGKLCKPLINLITFKFRSSSIHSVFNYTSHGAIFKRPTPVPSSVKVMHWSSRPGCVQALSSPVHGAGTWPPSRSAVSGMLNVRGRMMGASKPEKSSLLTSPTRAVL